MRLSHLCAVVLLMLGATAARAADPNEPVGRVRTASGAVQLVRAGVALPVKVGAAVLAGDVVETGADSSVGITFEDDCRISLGPRSRVDLSAFEFAPAERRYTFVLKMAQGTLQYISGLIAKLAPAAISIETPTGTIAVRGTRFLLRVEGP